ncbi:MAG: TRAP transporter small permease subunit [Alphaproteobacteria bacterium]|nr:TRAP transporter small permease subunit [Alphaproteobacteria bacterium]
MKKLLVERLCPALDAVGWALAVLAMAQVVVIIAVQIYEVIARYVFNAPTLWGSDIAYMTNGTLFLLGAAYTLRMGAHIRIDFLATRLPLRVQHAINLLFYAALFLPLLWYVGSASANKAWRAYLKGELESMSAWEPLVWPFYTGITVGLAGLGLQVLSEALRHLVGVADPRAVPPPGATDSTTHATA